MNKRHVLTGVLSAGLVLVFVTGCQSAKTPSLNDYFLSEGCNRSCWNGIEPGKTDTAELEQILDSLEIEYEKDAYGDSLLYVFFPDESLINPTIDPLGQTSIHASNRTVTYVHIMAELCLSSFIAEYGPPDAMIDNPSYLQYLYIDKRLRLIPWKADPSRIGAVGLYSDEYGDTEFKRLIPFDESVLHTIQFEQCTDAFTGG